MGFGLTTNEIKVTEAARDYLHGILNGASGLRLCVVGGKGCGGHEYDLQPAGGPQPGDDTLAIDETLRLYIPMVDNLKLFGTTIDYRADDLGNARLTIDNPNEKGRCGCGESVVF